MTAGFPINSTMRFYSAPNERIRITWDGAHNNGVSCSPGLQQIDDFGILSSEKASWYT